MTTFRNEMMIIWRFRWPINLRLIWFREGQSDWEFSLGPWCICNRYNFPWLDVYRGKMGEW